MPGVVHGGPDEVVHRRVEDQELAPLALLGVDDPRHHQPGIADDQAAWLDGDLAAEMPDRALDQRPVVEGQRRRLVRAPVGDAQPAPEVEPPDGVAVGAQRLRQLGDLCERRLEGRQLGQLRADMHVDADHLDAGQARRPGVDLASAADRHAELVLRLAGGDLGVSAGVDVRVHPHRDRRHGAHPPRHLVEQRQLRLALDVELADAGGQRLAHLPGRLADAREDDAPRRHAGGQRPRQLAARDHVGPGAQPRQRGDHRLVRVGLERIGDQVVEAGKRLLEHPVMPLERGGGIDVEGRADRLGDRLDGHLLGMQPAADVVEMVHAGVSSRSARRPARGPPPSPAAPDRP